MKRSRPQLAAWIGTGCLAVTVVVYGASLVRELAAESASKLDPASELRFTPRTCDMPQLPAEPEPVEYEDVKRGLIQLNWIERPSPKEK